MTVQDQKQLGKTLWGIADQLRGAMNADDFRTDLLLNRQQTSPSYFTVFTFWAKKVQWLLFFPTESYFVEVKKVIFALNY